MIIPLVAIVVLVIGLILHWVATGSAKNGAPTVAELGRAMIWVGLFFTVAALLGHGSLVLSH